MPCVSLKERKVNTREEIIGSFYAEADENSRLT